MEALRESSAESPEARLSVACVRNIAPRFFSSLKHVGYGVCPLNTPSRSGGSTREVKENPESLLSGRLKAPELKTSLAFGPTLNLQKSREMAPPCKPSMVSIEDREDENGASLTLFDPIDEGMPRSDKIDKEWAAHLATNWSPILGDKKTQVLEKIYFLTDDSFIIELTTERLRR